MKPFEIDVKNLKISGSELDISKTVEELLELNSLLTKRKDSPSLETTEKQLESSDYDTKKKREEIGKITELQFEREDFDYDIIEVKASSEKPENGGHNSKTWESNKNLIEGHKDLPKIYEQHYKKNRGK